MKALNFVLITAILSFVVMSYEKNVTPLVGHEKVIPTAPNSLFCPECPILSPKVPLEAPFGEMTEFASPLNLVPVVPMEATFDDIIELGIITDLTPRVPMEATFDDMIELGIITDLTPRVPMEADFDDCVVSPIK